MTLLDLRSCQVNTIQCKIVEIYQLKKLKNQLRIDVNYIEVLCGYTDQRRLSNT